MSPPYLFTIIELWPINDWDLLASLEHPGKFQRVSRLGFVTAATSLNECQQNFAALNRGRHLYSAGRPSRWALAHISSSIFFWLTVYIQFSGAFALWRNFARCKLHFASKSCVLLYWQHYCTTVDQWASAKLCSVVQGMELWNFCRRRHLYSAGRPSRWGPHSSFFTSARCEIDDTPHCAYYF